MKKQLFKTASLVIIVLLTISSCKKPELKPLSQAQTNTQVYDLKFVVNLTGNSVNNLVKLSTSNKGQYNFVNDVPNNYEQHITVSKGDYLYIGGSNYAPGPNSISFKIYQNEKLLISTTANNQQDTTYFSNTELEYIFN